jgi:hypothetical protein
MGRFPIPKYLLPSPTTTMLALGLLLNLRMRRFLLGA